MPGGLIIIGASHAGVQLVARCREFGYDEPITLINGEPDLPYQRPPLCKDFLLGKIGESRLSLRPASFFDEARVELISGNRCVEIDRTARTIKLSDRTLLTYDKLVLATGSRARALPASFGKVPAGVMNLRTLADARRLREAAQIADNAVIVGGGFVGLEVASSLSMLGCHVSLIEFQPRLLARSCSRHLAAAITRTHAGAGISLHLEAGLVSINAKCNKLDRVTLTNGKTLDADLLLFGIGVSPDVELADHAGLPCEDGIIVDEYAQTADPRILAIGDCTSFPSAQLGIRIRLECIQNANDQAATAAAALVGRPLPYISAPRFWSEQHASRLQMIGFLDHVDETIKRGEDDRSFSLWHFAQRQLQAVETINRPEEFVLARRLISSERFPTPEEVAKPDFSFQRVVGSQC